MILSIGIFHLPSVNNSRYPLQAQLPLDSPTPAFLKFQNIFESSFQYALYPPLPVWQPPHD